MDTTTMIGIWMDHKSAHIMELTSDSINTTVIESKFNHSGKESGHKGENGMHNKEQHQHSEYYQLIADKIRQYDSVVLFGPTNAKTELFNILTSDHLFTKIKIHVEQADKMTQNQEHAFVRKHFGIN